MTEVFQPGDFIHFVEVVSDTPAAKVYRVRAGKWPTVDLCDERSSYPPPKGDTPDYHRWAHGAATLVLLLKEDGDPKEYGVTKFFDDDAGGEWLVTAHKRCVWVVLVRNAPPRFTGAE